MNAMTDVKLSFEDGREAQFREMMEQLALLQSKYKGVRGELLARVHDEFLKLKPSAPAAPPLAAAPAVSVARTPSAAPEKILPSCRLCGRGMKVNGSEGNLICAKGHTRLAP